jgi:hypothetical protein
MSHNTFDNFYGTGSWREAAKAIYSLPYSHLYTHKVSPAGNYGIMLDGFKINGSMYEFATPMPYNQWAGFPSRQGGRHNTANDLWNICMGGAGVFADVRSNGMHNSIYWVQKNGNVTLTKNIGNNYLLKRSNTIGRTNTTKWKDDCKIFNPG